ncbi:OmpA family protein [Caldimonas aquatica]|uniref:OmpA-like domain-containing protein n=1 Tax=Caldimonas aquatica TaxID=376175 RepID=A0ABY6MRZ7_9BURK|nr:OmpA family protein [Schlegelella aquatica]UZD54772.1 hypothetical protein OMP39_14085 [Schlegelella aquatica]
MKGTTAERARHHRRALRLSVAPAMVALAALVAGCAGIGGGPGRPGGPAAASLSQQRWQLEQDLAGTPVEVASAEGGYRVSVPLKYSFDRQRSAVKPPLAAVLDRVARVVRSGEGVRLRVSAPPDRAGADLLAQDRAASVRDYLVARGVPRARFAEPGPATPGGVVEVLVAPAR